MVSEKVAIQQVLRLTGLRRFPVQKEAQEELVKALIVAATNEKHAESIITDWLKTETEAPAPAHIYAENDQYAISRPAWKGPMPWSTKKVKAAPKNMARGLSK